MKRAILALILAVTMFATGCSTSWLTTFDNYVAIAAPAVVQIITAVDVAEGVPVDQAALANHRAIEHHGANADFARAAEDGQVRIGPADVDNGVRFQRRQTADFRGDLIHVEPRAVAIDGGEDEIARRVGAGCAALIPGEVGGRVDQIRGASG